MRGTGRGLGGHGQQGAVNHIEWPPQFRHVGRRTGIKVAQGELNDWRRIDDATISLAEATRPRGNGLLTDIQIIAVCTWRSSVEKDCEVASQLTCPAFSADGPQEEGDERVEWQTHRRTRSTYDVYPVETDSFPVGSGWNDIGPLSGKVDGGRSHSTPASDHPHKAISLDSAMDTGARLASRSLKESSAGHGEGDPMAPHLASAFDFVAESAGHRVGRVDTETDAERRRSRFPAGCAAIAVCMAFASPTEAAVWDWAWLARTVAAASEGPLRGTALLPWVGSIAVLDPVGWAGAVSRT